MKIDKYTLQYNDYNEKQRINNDMKRCILTQTEEEKSHLQLIEDPYEIKEDKCIEEGCTWDHSTDSTRCYYHGVLIEGKHPDE